MDEIAEDEVREAEEARRKKQGGNWRSGSEATIEDDRDDNDDYDDFVSWKSIIVKFWILLLLTKSYTF